MASLVGIDIGTSGVKAIVLREGTVAAECGCKLEVSRPRPGWSEQHPDTWIEAVFNCLDHLAADGGLADARAIGLSGQMLGLVLLGRDGSPIRPAILWNDQRATRECDELESLVPDIGMRTNCGPDPGINAAKLLWIARHEPGLLGRARMLLLPKDYVRLALTGDTATEPTDAGGTQLFDIPAGNWDAGLCSAVGWDPEFLPPVVSSWTPAGSVRSSLAKRWRLAGQVVVAGGAGDNMAATLGIGAASPGEGVVTVGTSAVSCLVDDVFRPAPESAVLTSPHAAPGRFLSMGVVMSATASLDWLAGITNTPAAILASEADNLHRADRASDAPVFLPALSGIRTPFGRPDAAGRIEGLRGDTTRAMLAWSTLEGVAFQIADCVEAQLQTGLAVDRVAAVGGGARSRIWLGMISSLLGVPLELSRDGPVAACLGAARLASVASGAEAPEDLRRPMSKPKETVQPDPELADLLSGRRARFRSLLSTELF